MRRLVPLAAALAVTATASAAAAQTSADALAEDAAPIAPGHVSAALLADTRVGVREGLELHGSAPAWLLGSPDLSAKIALRRTRGATFSLDAGLSIPTMAFRLTRGYLVPEGEVTGVRPGFVLVAKTGLLATFHAPRGGGDRVTVRFDTAFRALGDGPAPLDTLAPLELLTAPATTGLRARLGGAYRLALSERVSATFSVDGYYLGATPAPRRSPFVAALTLGASYAPTRRLRLTAGVLGTNADQRATTLVTTARGPERRAVRSNDLFPIVDLAVAF